MRNVWMCCPTAQRSHVKFQLEKWKDMGYKIALLVDVPIVAPLPFDLVIHSIQYPNVWRSWNALARAVMSIDADVAVLVGDDMDPDPKLKAHEIADRYFSHFRDGFGVFQPTGDRQAVDGNGKAAAERIAGSPWVGREWCKRAYQGNGPVNGSYGAFYADEELQEVAIKCNAFIQDPEITQWHRHWTFGGFPRQDYHDRNNRKHWKEDSTLFIANKAAGFPDARPLGYACC